MISGGERHEPREPDKFRIGTAIERHDTAHQRNRVEILHSIPQQGGYIGIFNAAERSLGHIRNSYPLKRVLVGRLA